MRQELSQGFSGTIDGLRLTDLVQTACLSQLSHMLRVESAVGAGRIFFRSGQVFHAETEGKRGEEAFCHILLWENGCFEAYPEDVPSDMEASIKRTWEYLLIEVLRLQRGVAAREENGAIDALQPTTGFSGHLGQIQLADLVQLACSARIDRIVLVRSADWTGRIFVNSGNVCHAEMNEVEGEDAFNEMVAAPVGEFETVPAPGSEDIVTIHKPWEYLLMDAMRFLDERGGNVEEKPDSITPGQETLTLKLQRMKTNEKIRLAMFADKEARTLLMRSPNRYIQLAVVKNPKITDGEVASLAASKTADEEVLRQIANTREWLKNYSVRMALACNPKTPINIATRLVQTLLPNDLRGIARSKSVPTAVAGAARRLVMESK